MNRLLKWGGYALGSFWALTVFLASNSPADVKAHSNSWLEVLAGPTISAKVAAFAGHPLVIGLTFTVVGGLIGWHLRKKLSEKGVKWWESLAIEMDALGNAIEYYRPSDSVEQINSMIGITLSRAKNRGLAVPDNERFKDMNSLVPYFRAVSTCLAQGEIGHARSAAMRYSV